MSWDEFQAVYVNGLNGNPHLRRPKNYVDLPKASSDSVDWVSKGAVTPVKNQGQCGSCWAFSTTGSFEGAYQVATGNLVSFSEQNLVSCDTVDDGCSGGLMDNAFGWIKSNGGLCTEDDYPYTSGSGSSGSCKTSCSKAATLTGWSDVKSGDEDALKSAVEKDRSRLRSRLISLCSSCTLVVSSPVRSSAVRCSQLDHGVLVVEHRYTGTDGGNDYWKVKNSWGASWGEEGYIRMIRDKDCCGIASQPSYPTGVSSVGPSLDLPQDLALTDSRFSAPLPRPRPPVRPTMCKCTSVHERWTSHSRCKASLVISVVPSGFQRFVSYRRTCWCDRVTQCILQDTSGDQYCALECIPFQDGQCGEGTCQEVQFGVGICTYDS